MRIYFFCFFLLISFKITAQDLIVTYDNDSIKCKIAGINENYIYYIYKNNEDIIKDKIDIITVKYYKKNFYGQTEIPRKEVSSYKIDFKGISINSIRFSFDSGLGIRSNIFKKKIFDKCLNIDLTSYPENNFGVGLLYNAYFKKTLNCNYIGILASKRFISKNKRYSFYVNATLGALFYESFGKDISKLDSIANYKLTGVIFNYGFNIGADYFFTPEIAIGTTLHYYSGEIKKTNIDDGIKKRKFEFQEKDYIDISRFMLTFGLKIIINR